MYVYTKINTHINVCIHKYKYLYTQKQKLIKSFVYTIIITHLNICSHKYKGLRNQLKYL